jgi:mono/diheme cytochrome c family protein
MTNPSTIDPDNLNRAGVLYHINCAACHGLTSQGDGPVGLKFVEYGAPQPPSFSSDRIASLSAGEAFWSITKGTGYMPPFGPLLAAEDRWLIVQLLSLSETERQDVLSKTKAPGYK